MTELARVGNRKHAAELLDQLDQGERAMKALEAALARVAALQTALEQIAAIRCGPAAGDEAIEIANLALGVSRDTPGGTR